MYGAEDPTKPVGQQTIDDTEPVQTDMVGQVDSQPGG